MKTLKRTFLPDNITHYKKDYVRTLKKPLDGKYITVEVLSNRLKGVNDLHGKPYQPTKHYFILEAEI